MAETNQQQYKARILEAAKVLFTRYGFRKTTVDEIAEWAGMAKSTMYKVFRTKEEILAELVVSEARAFRRAYMTEIKKLDDPLRKIEMLCRESSNYFNRYPFLGRVMVDEERRFTPFLRNEVSFVEDGIREIITKLLHWGLEAGALRPLNVPDAVETILALMWTFAYHQTPGDAENSEWVTFVLNGIKSPEGDG